jgi:hypothetical protein
MKCKFFAIALALLFVGKAATLCAQQVPLGGFIPFVGIGLTDEFKDAGSDLSGTFFLAQQELFMVGDQLSGGGSPYYDIALLDTGAATHILTSQASGSSGFDIDGNDFDGTNIQQIGGATGLINLEINDPLAIYAAGLGDRTSAGASLQMDSGVFRGQSSVATLSAPTQWALPNILGLPMAAHHAIHIKNSEPQLFELNQRTVRTPQVEFFDLGTGNQQGIQRRTDLKIRPGSSFIAGPLYIQNLDILGGNFDFHENPLSPTIVENGAMFIDVDLANGSKSLQDKELLFDTGADLTVVSELTAARLGFDPVLDEPDFVLEVEGSGGVSSGIPGFYLDELNIDTVGGSFTMTNVPIAVLDVTNPNDPGNTIDGILGMHLFTGRDIVIDINPSIGQGGSGPSLYIGDPVTETHAWSSNAASANWATPSSWSAPGTPTNMWVVHVSNPSGSPQTANVLADSTVFQLIVSGNAANAMTVDIAAGATLTTFGETRIDGGGQIVVNSGSKLDAQFINIEDGTLTGGGDVFVGTGPINGAVRNLSGRVEPGDGIGQLSIVGDLSNLVEGTLAFELGGLIAETEHDQIELDRFAFLAGTLEVSLVNGFDPDVGDMFTLISAEEGVVGMFDQLMLPEGYTWSVDYLANSVSLAVTGLGSLAGDFDSDGDVDGQDLSMMQAGYGAGTYQGADFLDWQRNFGGGGGLAASTTVPEPGAAFLLIAAAVLAAAASRAA